MGGDAALAGVSLRTLGILAGVGLVGLVLAYLFYPVATTRIDGFLFGEGDNFQVENALRTLTAGGLFGMGPGGGTRKFGLPEPHTDYIFSVIGEEFGPSPASPSPCSISESSPAS